MPDIRTDKDGITETLAQAVEHHRAGRLDMAEPLYRCVLKYNPRQPDALNFLGILLHQTGRSDAAIVQMREAMSVCPSHPDIHSNLGNMLKDNGRQSEAESCYRKAIALAPGHVNAHYNLAVVLQEQNKMQEALAEYRTTVDLQPGHGHARYHLGMHLFSSGQVEEAERVFREWLAYEPDNPLVLHMLSAWTGDCPPARASDAFVRETFDRFADSFDAQLDRLDYKAPELLVEAVRRHPKLQQAGLDILDAGCGTGLCGPLLRPFSECLTGVDLSAGMLEKARERGVYDKLEVVELSAFLQASVAQYDLIASADTLCYFGDLEEVLRSMASALRDGGIAAFTLEETKQPAAGDGFQLNPHGRYSHTEDYVRRIVDLAQLSLVCADSAVLRLENGRPVYGFVVVVDKQNRG